MTLYPEIVRSLLQGCQAYRQRELDLESLKSAIWAASREITAIEDRALRHSLIHMEADLDSTQFTVDSDRVFDETCKLAEALESILIRSLTE